VVEGRVLHTKLPVELSGQGMGQSGFGQVAVLHRTLSSFFIRLHGRYDLSSGAVHLRLHECELVPKVHRGQAGEALEQIELLLECLRTLGALGSNSQLAGASKPTDECEHGLLQPYGSCHQEGVGQVRILRDAIVISEERCDPGFGTPRIEEAQLVFDPLEVGKVPVIVEGRAFPGDPSGRRASAERLQRGHIDVDPPALGNVLDAVDKSTKLEAVFLDSSQLDRSVECVFGPAV
jgi:hypothetical protein